MAWQPAVPTNFEANTLQQRVYQFQHPEYGTLVITRAAKPANSAHVVFALRLTPPNGQAINAICNAAVDNRDNAAHALSGTHRLPGVPGTSTIGYWDINISSMGHRGIIYLVHHLMATAGRELGVTTFIVTSVVNTDLDNVCQSCGMRYAVQQSAWEGSCHTVEERARAKSRTRGWI